MSLARCFCLLELSLCGAMLFSPRKNKQPTRGEGDWNFLCGAQCLLELYVCGAIHLTPPTTTTTTKVKRSKE